MLAKDAFNFVLLFLFDALQQEIGAFHKFKLVPEAMWIQPENIGANMVNSAMACWFLCYEAPFCAVANYSKNESICRLSSSKFVEFSSENTTNELTIYTKASVYAINNEKKSWDDAKLSCEAKGWHLADIKSPDEQTLLQNAVPELIGSYEHGIWIGASKQNDKFVWNDGSAIDGFSYWLPHRPEVSDNKNCVDVRPGNGDTVGTTSRAVGSVLVFVNCHKDDSDILIHLENFAQTCIRQWRHPKCVT